MMHNKLKSFFSRLLPFVAVISLAGLVACVPGPISQPSSTASISESTPIRPNLTTARSVSAAIDRARVSVVRVETDNSIGSGVVVDKSGHILTNSHVVASSTAITVILNDGHKVAAYILQDDANTDLAILKIESGDLHEASFGEPNSLNVGDDVISLGFSLALVSCQVIR